VTEPTEEAEEMPVPNRVPPYQVCVLPPQAVPTAAANEDEEEEIEFML
jgi:hypothetical protein